MTQTQTPQTTRLKPTSTVPDTPLTPELSEGFVGLFGRTMYRIPDYDRMPPFLVSVVSEADLWAFVSSYGGLTAGRTEPARCLFPYTTDDQLHVCHPYTGPQTELIVTRGNTPAVTWRPFQLDGSAPTRRCLYKPIEGTQLVFEETRDDLQLRFRYRWAPTDAFGLVRTVWLDNLSDDQSVGVRVCDALLNLLPAGVPLLTLQRASCLVDAYTLSEMDELTGLATIALTTQITDSAEPYEATKANVAWTHGLDDVAVALDDQGLDSWRSGGPIEPKRRMVNARTAFRVYGGLRVEPGASARWHLVADADRTQAQVVRLRRRLIDRGGLGDAIDDAVDDAAEGIAAIVAAADGLQQTAGRTTAANHFSNVMFNSMRGGAVANGYRIDTADVLDFARTRNRPAARRVAPLLDALPESIELAELTRALDETDDPDLIRLGMEYLPLTFGRRHGDPSRPWNMFAIRIRNHDGSRRLDYQGNWRDIFQNWEALALSYPGYLESMIAKFVNASTRDGHNPYRIGRDGIDWEKPDPDDPWANVGYWGDHQIVYLMRLLELSERYHPGRLAGLLDRAAFSYANVPYRLKPYAELIADPKQSIDFDHGLDKRITADEDSMGSDARLERDARGNVRHVNLAEKLIVPVLAKLSNLVIGGGTWMNTQRPEWNDANNALAGWGLSLVTTCYLRRQAALIRRLIDDSGPASLAMSRIVSTWLGRVSEVLGDTEAIDRAIDDPAERRRLLDALGAAYETYNRAAYAGDQLDTAPVSAEAIRTLCDRAVNACDATIRSSRRDDGLYHGYNVLKLGDGVAEIKRLPVMLEGQVAVLSSGLLEPQEAADMLDAMFESSLYRPDVRSFTLYPVTSVDGFLKRNRVDTDGARNNPLLAELLAHGDTRLIAQDDDGVYRFAAPIGSAEDLNSVLKELADDTALQPLVEAHRAAIEDLFEQTFHHHGHTGRSGKMHGYEGIGCVYWHMVAKLLLAVQETHRDAQDGSADPAAVQRLGALYRRVRAGLGFTKTAGDYGAFPTDAYSHTPGNRGAQQPGMTGQVKEQVLTRAGELGVSVDHGRLTFDPHRVHADEWLDRPAGFDYLDVDGEPQRIDLPDGSLALTVCQTPIVYRRDAKAPSTGVLEVLHADGTTRTIAGHTLDESLSRDVFERTGGIRRVTLTVPPA
ncbi:MAG: hypothetical protein AAGI54_07130 [Planctomycetota bacterium]